MPGDGKEILADGVANAGLVVRIGDEVRRPASARRSTVHAFLRRLHAQGFDGVPMPVGSPAVDEDGRERLEFIPGEVPLPPYPAWAQTDRALASVARLLRRFHDASRLSGAGSAGSTDLWSDELADPSCGPDDEILVCHNDVCLENVVFSDGEAVALLDLDFAAPGRPLYDLAQLARTCAPVDDPLSAAPEFVAMWQEMGGMARFDRRRAWFAEIRETLGRDL